MSFSQSAWSTWDESWYRKTSDPRYAVGRKRIDAVWNSACDEIVRRYVATYGTFFTAFFDALQAEVEALTQTNLPHTHYGPYFATRAWEMRDTREFWRTSYEAVKNLTYRCATCESRDLLVNAHPDLVRRHWTDMTVCRPCDYVLRRYAGMGPAVLELVPELMRMRRLTARRCDLCGATFSLPDSEALSIFQSTCVDAIYPNLFAGVCPECSRGALHDCSEGSPEDHLARLYDLFLHTGRVPTQDLTTLIYSCRDADSVLQLVRLLQKTRTPKGYAEEFGSFLGALIASGILPEGSRKLLIGTMVLAKDGHVCLSVAEKEVDDFLSDHGLAHEKEVRYPGCNLRCDWEVFTGSDSRVFIEYFGMMNNPDYARRAEEKIDLAQRSGIELVTLYPDADWAGKLADKLLTPSTRMPTADIPSPGDGLAQ
jgi:hypothetical protein